jgi:signal peptidase I
MSWVAGFFGFFFPSFVQALTGRWRAALSLVASLPLVLLAAIAWPPLAWLALAIPPASAVDAALAHRRGAAPAGRRVVLAVVVLAALIAESRLLRSHVASSYKIPSSSMVPTLAIGDLFLVEQLSLWWSPPQRGELILFELGANRRIMLGRVVAIAGDEIAVRDNAPIVSGKPAERKRIGTTAFVDGDLRDTVTIFEESLGGHRYRTLHRPHPEDAERGSHDDYPRRDGGGSDTCTSTRVSAQAGVALLPSSDGTACVVPAGTIFYLGDNRWNSNDSRYQGAVPLTQVVGRIRGIWLPAADQDGKRWSRLGLLQ